MDKLAVFFYMLSFQGPLRMTYSERIWWGQLPAQASRRKLLQGGGPRELEEGVCVRWGRVLERAGLKQRRETVKGKATSLAEFARSPMTCVEARTISQASPKITCKMSKRI